jgi:hypothetical protein
MRRNCCQHDANAPQPPERMIRAANPATRLTTKDISMTTLTKTYPTELAARRAAEALRATGVPERDIRLLAGTAPRDIPREPVGGFAGPVAPDAPIGGFAGPVAPDAPIGTYGGRVLRRRQGAGSFAGDPDQQRQGSFADTDRVVIVTYEGDAERARITGLRGARRLLRRAAVDDDAVDRGVSELHRGHAILLVKLSEITASEIDARLEKLARAA